MVWNSSLSRRFIALPILSSVILAGAPHQVPSAFAASYTAGSLIQVGDVDWKVGNSPFGVQEVETANFEDGMDYTTFWLDNAELECDSANLELEASAVDGIDSRVTCTNPFVTGASANLGFEAFIDFFDEGSTPLSVDGDLARTVVSISNTGGVVETFTFYIEYDFGYGGVINNDDALLGNPASFNISSGIVDGTLPVFVAVGNIPGAEVDDADDDLFDVVRSGYELAPGDTLTVAYFHRVLDPSVESDIERIGAKLYYDALPEFSSYSGRISLGLDPDTVVTGWSDLTSRDSAVGDVSSAMRYDSDGPYGAPVGFIDPDYWDFDDNAQYFDLSSTFPLNFFGTKADSICVTTNGVIIPSAGNDAFSQCGDGYYNKSLEQLALVDRDPLISALGADINLEECAADQSGNESRYFDGFGYPCSVYVDTEAVIDGVEAVVVTWYRVNMFNDANDDSLFNTFQVVLLKKETTDATNGYDFRIEFNYGTIQDAEEGYDVNNPGSACGGLETCRWTVGWSDYDSGVADAYELFPNNSPVELVDGQPTALTANSLNSSVPGRYSFQMVGGITTGFSIPDLGPQSSRPNAKPVGAPGIFLTVTGQIGDSLVNSPILYGADRVQADSFYQLSIEPLWQTFGARQILDSGTIDQADSFESSVTMSPLLSGHYRLVLTGRHRDGSPLVLTNVIVLGSAGEYLYISPEALQPVLR